MKFASQYVDAIYFNNSPIALHCKRMQYFAIYSVYYILCVLFGCSYSILYNAAQALV
jgi:hypothetical protein